MTPEPHVAVATGHQTVREPGPTAKAVTPDQSFVTLLVSGTVPSESWNRVGMKLVPKLRVAHSAPRISVEFSVRVGTSVAGSLEAELRRVLDDLGLGASMTIREETE